MGALTRQTTASGWPPGGKAPPWAGDHSWSVGALAPGPGTPRPCIGTPHVDLDQSPALPVQEVYDTDSVLVARADVVSSRLCPHRRHPTLLLVPEHRVFETRPRRSTCDRIVVTHAVIAAVLGARACADDPASKHGEPRRDKRCHVHPTQS